MTRNQAVSGQVDIAGHVQNIRPASTTGTTGATTAAAATNTNNDINTANMTVVEATFFDNADNVVGVQHVASDPNILRSGESSTFHIIVNDGGNNNIAKATYLAQWVGVDNAGTGVLLHPTA